MKEQQWLTPKVDQNGSSNLLRCVTGSRHLNRVPKLNLIQWPCWMIDIRDTYERQPTTKGKVCNEQWRAHTWSYYPIAVDRMSSGLAQCGDIFWWRSSQQPPCLAGCLSLISTWYQPMVDVYAWNMGNLISDHQRWIHLLRIAMTGVASI